jgi:hypothetical protein
MQKCPLRTDFTGQHMPPDTTLTWLSLLSQPRAPLNARSSASKPSSQRRRLHARCRYTPSGSRPPANSRSLSHPLRSRHLRDRSGDPSPPHHRSASRSPSTNRPHTPVDPVQGQTVGVCMCEVVNATPKNWAPGAGTDPWATGSARGQGPPPAPTMRARGAAADLGNLPTAERASLVVE